ncbi:MAG TPA: WxcM-like domain-containing protein [Patescibacteria group bacterium]|nr:WxcM-like domain-containing protein [Patescibacteria group bacterium]
MTNQDLPKVIKLVSHVDERGAFIELLKKASLPKTQFGQLSITTIEPKQQKGNHYHKIRWEWFYIIEGDVEIELIKVTTKKRKKLSISSKNPSLISIPPYWNHILFNKSTHKATAVVYSSIEYMKNKPDVYYLDK